MRILFFLLIALCLGARAQDTTRILFVGNSFTYYHNMPQLLKALADSAHKKTEIAMHAPGGISVGDTIQGTQAHMNNPVLYALIRSRKWDVVVIQDNQGRFVRDSAQFPASSKVVEGHLKIMDSVKAVNNCAKIVLFCGWAFKNGSPPFGNTGIDMIKRISRNYVVLNDTMKEVIAPIGEAWVKGINYLSTLNLWDPDDAHPSYAGSYLTASVIFSTIFNLTAKTLLYNGSLPVNDAYKLRCFADTAVFDPLFHVKYNLGGMRRLSPLFTNGQLTIPGNSVNHDWYWNGLYYGNPSVLTPTVNGDYKAIVKESDGCLIKTCTFSYSVPSQPTGMAEQTAGSLSVYPNPVEGGYFTVETPGGRFTVNDLELTDLLGKKQEIRVQEGAEQLRVSIGDLRSGYYVLSLRAQNRSLQFKMLVNSGN